MATITNDASSATVPRDETTQLTFVGFLRALGSLKLTVGLFAVSLVLVLVGTLAQDEMNMLGVKQRYFLSWIAMLHFDDFFPQAFYRHDRPIPGVIPFPGGALVGVLLILNLVAAKATRFKLQASGGKLAAGIGFLIAGVLVGALIVASGHNSDGLQGTPPISYPSLWGLILAAMAILSVGSIVAAGRAASTWSRVLLLLAAVALGAWVVYSLSTGARIGDPGLRIVWQLTKGLGAGLVLLVGCLLVFGKQGGNVLLHLGVGLLMVGQFAFGDRQLEQRLSLVEGQSTNTFVNLDEIEMTFVRDAGDAEHVIAIPSERLQEVAGRSAVLEDEELPVDVRVLEYFPNSSLGEVTESNPATKGIGLEAQAFPEPKSGGAENEVNLAAAYVELLEKGSGESLGTYLVSQSLSDREILVPDGTAKNFTDTIEVDGETYEIGLKMHREVKPYWVQLEDVRRVNYSGTDTPRDYSSFIRIVDQESGEDRRERVWMNNPLRYRGETFYQSNYTSLPGGKELTGIQVVRNSGWLIPYVACSITALGMLVHFWGTLTRFLGRRRRETAKESEFNPAFQETQRSQWPVVVSVAGFALFALIMLTPASALKNELRPKARNDGFDLYTLGQIPVQYGGRVMPLDAYARQTLKAISNKESLPLESAPGEIKERAIGSKLSALQWLMEVAIDEPTLAYLPMFRIDAEEVRSELGLERRESKLYSLDEIRANLQRFTELVKAAGAKDTAEQSFKEKKLIELDLRTRQYTLASASFRLPIPEQIPEELFPEGTTEQMRQMFALQRLQQQMEALSRMKVPAIIPPPETVVENAVDQPEWAAFAPAFFEMAKTRSDADDSTRPGIDTFGQLIRHYADQDPAAFNQAVDQHLAEVRAYPIAGYDLSAVAVERWMTATHPTTVATALYVIALVLSLIFFATDSQRLRSSIWGLLVVAMVIHTITIAARVYITGRAPVINLYSSAVFVGWAAVLFGLVVERIFRYGTGNILAAFAGMLTLRVAYGLTLNVGQAETMPVLQAVLDTQFWLTTHVITVALGYVATMVAGTLGIGYLIATWLQSSDKSLRDLYRCTYGAACFGILFSFVGTVLGGLWADDSWGRFWGWDPKENGALLIVIWNALMLHARWDGMVKARGFSILAIGGNIITAWSWFGTNELGIGLHSYGFTSGVLMWLSIFIATQLGFIVVGLLTRRSGESVSL